MKNRINSFFSHLPLSYLFLTILTISIAQFATAQIPSYGLVGCWNFSGNLNDASSNGNNGIMQPGNNGTINFVTDRFGNANSAIEFVSNPVWNSLGPYVEIPNSQNLLVNSDFTITYSIKVSAQNVIGEIINKGGDNISNVLFTRVANGILQNSITTSGIINASNFPIGSWQTITISYSNLVLSYYLNGVFQSSTSAGPIQSTLSKYYFGAMVSGSSNGSFYPFQGVIDDISFYNRALTPAEITLLYTDQTSTVQAPCPTLATNLQTGLVGYWPFCGNANDESGNGNNGTVNGATLTTDRFGNANSAYYFDGSVSTKISVDLTNTIQGTKTFSVWLKYPVNFINPYSHIITLENAGNVGVGNEYLSINGNHPFYVSANTVGKFYDGKTGLPSLNFLNDNIWHNLILIHDYDNSQSRLYIDGIFQGSANSSNFTNNPIISHLTFGSVQSNVNWANSTVLGTLDDISIYNRALTPNEITQLFTDPSVTPPVACTPFLGEDQTVCAGTSVTLSASASSLACPTLPSTLQNGLVGYWPFCGNASDASGNGNNGTVNGATLTTDRFGNANSAYNFDGTSGTQNISTNFLGVLGNNSRTIGLWFRESVLETNSPHLNNLIRYGLQSQGGSFELATLNNRVGALSNNTAIFYEPSAFGDWHFVTLVYDPSYGNNISAVKVYLDGVILITLHSTYNLGVIFSTLQGEGLSIGGVSQITQFNGKIDDVSIHNRALSASEIQQLYTLGQSTYLWSNGATTPTINVTPASTTTYTCTVTDTNGNVCTDSVTVFVPQIEATNLTICIGESTTLSATGLNTNLCPALPNTLQSGLVGYWPFCGNANDESGNGNNGTVNGATLTTDRFGNANSAYSFDGTDQISIAQNPQISFGQNLNFTYSNWFYAPTSPNSDSEFRFFAAFGSSDNQNISVYSGGFQLGLINAGHNIYLELGATASEMFVSNFGVQLNAWHHFAISVDRNSDVVTVYLDGINIGTRSIPNNYNYTPCCNSPLLIGGERMYNQQHYFIGAIDDVSVFNRALNNSEIQQLFTLGQTTYLWSNGATTPTINVSPTTPTTYTCTVTTNGVSCTDSVTVVVGNPLASITPNGIVEICQGQSISLTGNGGVSYLWNTGAPTQSITVNTEATYTVTVTDANGCTDTESQLVKVNQLPIIGVSNASICPGQSATLTANGGVSYVWSPATGLSATTGSTVTASPATSTLYSVTGTGANGCTNTATAAVSVNALPTATITTATTTTFCQGGSVVLNANTGTGLTYQWKLNGTNITGATSSTYTANASGSYTVVVTNTSTCSSTSTATVVTVNTLPTSTITAATATTFCQGGSVVLTANTGTGLSYQWKLNGTNITGATSSSYTANVSGSYTVVVTNASTCSSTSTATVVTVNALPTATITAATATTFCQGGSVVLNANTGTGLSYQWKLNGTNITGATSSSYTANASGSYTVVVTNASTCSSTSTATVVTVNALPTATITAATATTFCQGGSVVLNTNTGTGLSYQWRLNGNPISGATSSSYTANASGSYTVVVTNASTCSSTSTATVVTVNALPTATITASSTTTFCQGGSVVLTANTGTGLSYQWFNNAVAIGGATTSSYNATASGTYSVVVTNNLNCSTTSSAINVTAVPNVDYYADADGDGFGDLTTLISTCVQPQGYVTDNTDCKDNDASIYPGAQEICNDVDDDCNDLIDDGLVFMTYYADTDGDSFGDVNNPLDACLLPNGYVTNNTDCNDNNSNQNAASIEICNDEDDDCDGTIDNGLIFLDYYADNDSDGFGAGAATNSCVDLGAGYVTNNSDCDDTNANTFPSATEVCNTIDDNCNNQIDEGLFIVYFIDNDGDAYGNPSVSTVACEQPIGYAPNDSDCNDNDVNINPAAEDLGGNGIDENCDGEIDNSIFELNASINLYPNPTRSELNIQITNALVGNDMCIFDAVGQLVYKQQLLSTQTIVSMSNYADGNYIFKVGEVVRRITIEK